MTILNDIVKIKNAFKLIGTKIFDEIPLQQLLLWLEIAEHGDKGITLKELEKLTGQAQASVSRSAKKLATYLEADKENPAKKIEQGYGLIRREIDMENPRMQRVFLTPKGKKLLDQVITTLAK